MLTSHHGRLLVDFVGRFETLEADFAAICRHLRVAARLPHVNAVSHDDYRAHYTPRLAAAVADGFGEDIERFGYAFDSSVAHAPCAQAA
jgi:hypothetical protein